LKGTKIRRTVLLDRDETLNFDPGYINDPDQIILKPGVVEGLLLLRDAGFTFFILTNQSGVGRGLITPEQLEAVHERLRNELEAHKIHIEKFYVCPHTDIDNCDCRKPKSGLVDRVFSDNDLDGEHCYLVGDRLRDIIPGEERGIPGILVYRKPDTSAELPSNLILVASDLKEAADHILEIEKNKQNSIAKI